MILLLILQGNYDSEDDAIRYPHMTGFNNDFLIVSYDILKSLQKMLFGIPMILLGNKKLPRTS